jgi:1,2-diacylglycerol 3-beta-glucosyltransferase
VTAIDVLYAALATPVLICSTYLLVLSIFANKRRAFDDGSDCITKFDIVVPAHDEEAGIAETVKSLLAIEYPAELRRILVVADNCTDKTAQVAEEAGATVLVRFDDQLRGKGYALAHAFGRVEKDAVADAVVVIDADTSVSANLLREFDRLFRKGAHAVQADYAVRNRESSWRTRLMVIALALFHVLRSLGRERLGLSAGLRGNGMGFSREVLREVPHDAFSVVEDLEYGIKLGQAGHRVHYAASAHVYGEMVGGEKASRSQRRRWEQGRFAMVKAYGASLFWAGLRKRNAVLFDLAMDVLVPPLSWLVLGAVLGSTLGLVLHFRFDHPLGYAAPWLISTWFIAIYVLRGWALSGVGFRGFLDLCWAPVYILWKVGLALSRPAHRKGEWVRTTRQQEERRK